MPSVLNQKIREEYENHLRSDPNFLMTRFIGLNVEEITALRKRLREKNVKYKVIKNNIFKLALKSREDLKDIPDDILTGPIGVVFGSDEITSAANLLVEFGKEYGFVKIISGVLESTYYNEAQAQSLSKLPGKKELLAIIAAGLNNSSTKITGIVQNVMSSLARAIKAIGEKNG